MGPVEYEKCYKKDQLQIIVETKSETPNKEYHLMINTPFKQFQRV